MKSGLIGVGSFLMFAFATVYMFGLYGCRAGNESSFVNEAVAAEWQ